MRQSSFTSVARRCAIVICCAAAMIRFCRPIVGAEADKTAARPSVLFILTDDQRYDTIHALGNAEIHTPVVDGLVARGFTFTNAYCQGGQVPAVCLPSRTGIMTGRSVFHLPANNGVYAPPTIGSVFRQAGYATLYCGKKGNSFRAGNEAFEKFVYCDKGVSEVPGSMGPDSPQALQPKLVADEALAFLNNVPADRSFFIFLAPHYPHDPRVAPTQFTKLYDPATLSLPKNFLPEHPFDNGALHVRDEELAPHPRTPEAMRQHLADYYACISHIDVQVGRLLDALKASGRDRDTIVIFTSDQGLAVGGWHGLMGKQNLYEEFKSPLVIAGPGISPGKSPALVYLHDLFPTACALTGLETPKECEGASLAPIIQGKTSTVRETLFGTYISSQRMTRDARWKVLWYPKIDRFQLFDLEHDPYEITDLSASAEHAAEFARMKQLLANEQDRFEDPGPRVK